MSIDSFTGSLQTEENPFLWVKLFWMLAKLFTLFEGEVAEVKRSLTDKLESCSEARGKRGWKVRGQEVSGKAC